MAAFELADVYAAEQEWNAAAQTMQEALDRFETIAQRRALRPDEKASLQAGLAKIADWKKK
jgi:hypothetical protein